MPGLDTPAHERSSKDGQSVADVIRDMPLLLVFTKKLIKLIAEELRKNIENNLI